MSTGDFLRSLPSRTAASPAAGVYAVCSTHPAVIDSALQRAAAGGRLIVETTSNQVNQLGGYTGMTPADFMRWMGQRAASLGVDPGDLVVGSDHAGPFPWRAEPCASAMEKARLLVAQCVKAGYRKIHLDATMRLGDDPGERRRPLDPRVGATRTAELAAAAEAAWHGLGDARAPRPMYVIGTDVPAPGGTEAGASAPEVTRPEDLAATTELCRTAFLQEGLQDAWARVIAVVVQPAVEHGERVIHRYDRSKVRDLVACRRESPGLVFEAHATDYQTPRALREMVEDGFAILKVGPSLTGAVREAIFLLDHIEQALAPLNPGMTPAAVPQALESAMLAEPAHWKAYYGGNEAQRAFLRKFALSDRCRYYWDVPGVRDSVQRLYANLRAAEIPAGLLSQYFPRQFLAIQEGSLAGDPAAIVEAHVQAVLDRYEAAVQG